MRFALRKAKNKIYLLTTRNIRREQPVQWRGRLLVIAGLLRAIAISRRRDHTPKVRSRNFDSTNLRAAIGTSRK